MKNNGRKNVLIRRGLAFLLAAVITMGYMLPGGAHAVDETEPATESTLETTVPETSEPAATEEETTGSTDPVCPGDDTCTIEGCTNHVAVCETCGVEPCVCNLDDAYLLNGAKIYKDYLDAEEEPKIIDKWNTGIKIKEVITAEDGTAWYYFTYTSIWAEMFNGYHYVRVSDATATRCSCETAPAADGAHQETCDFYVAPTAYEKAMADLTALEEEAKTLEVEVEVLNEFTACLRDVWNDAYDLNEEGQISDEELEAIDAKGNEILAYLKDTYGYVDGKIAVLENVDADEALKETATPDGLNIHLFDYGGGLYKTEYDAAGNQIFPLIYMGCGSVNDDTASMYLDVLAGDDYSAKFPTITELWSTYLGDDGYPFVTPKNTTTGASYNASLKKYFDKGQAAATKTPYDDSYIVERWIGPAGDGHGYWSTNYDVLHYPVSGGLFSKEGSYFVFNSRNNHAYYDYDTRELKVAKNYAISPGYNVDGRYTETGHFLPFTGRASQYDDANLKIREKQTANFPEKSDIVGYPQNIDYNETAADTLYAFEMPKLGQFPQQDYETVVKNKVDMYLGLTVDFAFNQPKGGKLLKAGSTSEYEDMIFEFAGDDQLVIYIDGIKVLDLGWAPTVNLGGSKFATINFNTGIVRVYMVDCTPDVHGNDSTYYTQKTLRQCFEEAVAAGANVEVPDYFADGSNTFKDYLALHFDMFYQDVGASTSNLMLRFNMDPLPENSLTVAKDVKNDPNNTSFGFAVEFKDSNDQPLTSVSYVDQGGKSGIMTLTNGKGTFSLADDEYYIFTLAAGYTYKVTELDANKNGYETTVSGAQSGKLNDKNSAYVLYTNTYVPGNAGADKVVKEGDTLGDYLIDLSAWSTGEMITTEYNVPVDVVFVLDQSASMYKPAMATDDLRCSSTFGGELGKDSTAAQKAATAELSRDEFYKMLTEGYGKYSAAEMKARAALPGYFIARNDDASGTQYGGLWYILKYEPAEDKVYYRRTCVTNMSFASNGSLMCACDDPTQSYCWNPNHDDELCTASEWSDSKTLANFVANGPDRIYITQYGKMYDAVTTFIDEAKATGVNHRIGLVGFAGASAENTALFVNGEKYKNSIEDETYKLALSDVQTNYDNIMKSVNKMVSEYGGTNPYAGLNLAQNVFKHATAPEEDTEQRNRIVIFVTDGEPNEPKNDEKDAFTFAIGAARPLKQAKENGGYGATVYSICTSSGTITDDDEIFLACISSEYPDATSMTDTGTKADGTYSYMEQNADSLGSIFDEIKKNELLNIFAMDSTTILRDVMSDEFDIPSEDIDKIKAYKVAYTGNGTFETDETKWEDVTDDVIIKVYDAEGNPITADDGIDGKRVDVTGFDYSKCCVIDYADGKYDGAKLVVRVPITMSDSNLGGNKQATNDPDESGLYDKDDEKIEDFPLPHVDTPATIYVKKVVTGNMGDWSKEFTFTSTGQKYVEGTNGKYYEDKDDTQVGCSNYLDASNTSHVQNDGVENNKPEIFQLKHYRDAEKNLHAITGLYDGSVITIKESDAEGYKVTITYENEEIAAETNANGEIRIKVEPGMTIIFTNHKDVTIDTGVVLESLPYIVILAVVVVAGVVLLLRKRKNED